MIINNNEQCIIQEEKTVPTKVGIKGTGEMMV